MTARRSGWLLLILAVALAVRLAVVAATAHQTPQYDAGDYDRHGASIAAGHGYPATVIAEPGGASALRPPTYPYLLAAVYALAGHHVTAGRVLGALLGVLAVLLLYLVARAVWDERVALLAAALAAVFPPLVMLNASLVSESLFVPLELGVILAVLRFRGRGGSLLWAVLVGVLCGLAALTREVALVLVVPAVIGVWTSRPALSWRALRAPALVVLATAVVIAPWTIRNVSRFHRFVPIATQDGLLLAGSYNRVTAADRTYRAGWRPPESLPQFARLFHRPGIDEARLNDELSSSARTYAAHHPFVVPEVVWWSLRRVFVLGGRITPTGASYREMGIPDSLRRTVTASAYVAFVLALAGVIVVVAGLCPRGPLFLWLVPVLMLVGVVLVLGTPRYRAPLDPFIVVLAALGVVTLAARRRGAPAGRPRAVRA